MQGQVYAVVLAGRRNEGALREASEVSWEALIDICGIPMVGRVLAALSQTPGLAGGVVVGPSEIRTAGALPSRFVLEAPGETVIENVQRGIAALRSVTPDGQIPHTVLISTSDVPLVTAPMVQAFLDAAGDGSFDTSVPVVRREVAEARFPGVQRTYIHLRDGSFTLGNLFLVKARLLQTDGNQGSRLDALVRLRKSPLRMAQTLGLGLVMGVATRRYSLRDLERVAGARMGIRGQAIVLNDPEIGVDVDKVSDLKLCREVLSDLAS